MGHARHDGKEAKESKRASSSRPSSGVPPEMRQAAAESKADYLAYAYNPLDCDLNIYELKIPSLRDWNAYKAWRIAPRAETQNLPLFRDCVIDQGAELLHDYLHEQKHKGFKCWVTIKVAIMTHRGESVAYETTRRAFYVYNEEDVDVQLASTMEELVHRVENFLVSGSGGRLEDIESTTINVTRYSPKRKRRARGYLHIDMGHSLYKSKSIINIVNTDNECLTWCVLLHRHPQPKNPQRVSQLQPYKHEIRYPPEYDPSKEGYPVGDARMMRLYEGLNNCCINVYQHLSDSQDIQPLYISSKFYETRAEDRINLLLIEGKNDKGKWDRHLLLIKNLDGVMGDAHNKHFFCPLCLTSSKVKSKIDKHVADKICTLSGEEKARKLIQPAKGEHFITYTGKETGKEARTLCNIYADFESMLVPVKKEISDNITALQIHRVVSYSWYATWDTDKAVMDVKLPEFGEYLQREEIKADQLGKDDVDQLGKDAVIHFIQSIWNFTNKLRDECQRGVFGKELQATAKYSPRFIMPQVWFRNLRNYDGCPCMSKVGHFPKLRVQSISVTENKHTAFTIENVGKFKDSILMVPGSLENNAKTTLVKLKNTRLKGTKLENKEWNDPSLTPIERDEIIQLETQNFHHVLKFGRANKLTWPQIRMLCEKGAFPYEAVSNYDVLNLKGIPDVQYFESCLSKSSLDTEEDNVERRKRAAENRERAVEMYNAFNCSNFGEYLLLYNKSDVLLDADIMTNFFNNAFNHFGVDPSHEMTVPGFANNILYKTAAKEHKNIQVECFHSGEEHFDMLEFCEQTIRGGICTVPNRWASANNEYVTQACPDHKIDKNQPRSFIGSWDANSLYAWAMTQSIPYGNYRWEPEETFTDAKSYDELMLKLRNLPLDGPEGCLIECDMDYPEHLHEMHRDFPLAPERWAPQWSDLTDFQKRERLRLHAIASEKKLKHKGAKQGLSEQDIQSAIDLCGDAIYPEDDAETVVAKQQGKVPKLICSVRPKRKYKVHYLAWQLYEKHGLVTRRVHRVLWFSQARWMKEYIENNISERAKAKKDKNDLLSDLFKLLNNSVFGKQMQNVRKYKKHKICTTWQQLERECKKPTFSHFKQIGEMCFMVEHLKTNNVMNKPIIIGAALLDISKTLIYRFHYEVILKKYKENAKLLFMDTDSLTYLITDPTIPSSSIKSQKRTHWMSRQQIMPPLIGQTTWNLYDDIGSDYFKDWIDYSPYKKEYLYIKNGKHEQLSKWSAEGLNASKLGCFKDVMADDGYEMGYEFIGPRCKCLSMLSTMTITDPEKLKFKMPYKQCAKGVPMALKRKLKHQHYKAALFGYDSLQTGSSSGFRMTGGQTQTVLMNKIILTTTEDKFAWISPFEKRAYGEKMDDIVCYDEGDDREVDFERD
jgi:hypothetical protein